MPKKRQKDIPLNKIPSVSASLLINDEDSNQRRRSNDISQSEVALNDTDKYSVGVQSPTNDFMMQLPSRLQGDVTNFEKPNIRGRKANYSNMSSIRIKNPRQLNNIIETFSNDPEINNDSAEAQEKLNAALKDLNTSLSLKRNIKSQLNYQQQSRKPRSLSLHIHLKYRFQMMVKHTNIKIKDCFYHLQLWRSSLKHIEGYFGTGVVSYFKFLKYLFLLNFPVFLLLLSFIIIPQVLYQSSNISPINSTKSFTGIEILTGLGAFENSILYYGFYTNKTISVISDLNYSMPQAYLMTQVFCYLFCLIVFARSMARSYRKNFIESRSDIKIIFVHKVFCGWDFGIISQEAADLRHKSIQNDLQEYLAYYHRRDKGHSFTQRLPLYGMRIIINCCVLGVFAGVAFALRHFFNTNSLKIELPFVQEMSLALSLSAINHLSPFLFSLLIILEKYDSPRMELTLTMTRDALFKGVSLGAFLYFWFNRNPQSVYEQNMEQIFHLKCWESLLGVEIYRLVIVDFFFLIVLTIVSELLPSLLHRCFNFKVLSQLEFDIARNTISLIYSQTLCWIGSFFCPLLSLIMICKLFLLFYIKRLSVLQGPLSQTRWRGARAKTVFLIFTFFCLLLAIISTGYAIVFVSPSRDCGPFRHFSSEYMFNAILSFLDYWKSQKGFISFITFITLPGCIASMLIILAIVVYYLHAVAAGHHTMVKLLKEQLLLEGKDKIFLMKITQQLINRKNATITPNDAAAAGDRGSKYSPRFDERSQISSKLSPSSHYTPRTSGIEVSYAASDRPLLDSFNTPVSDHRWSTYIHD